MDNKKTNQYYLDKIKTDLAFIIEHTKDLSKSDLEKNELVANCDRLNILIQCMLYVI